MIAELIILGLAIKVILGAVKRGRQRQTAPNSTPARRDRRRAGQMRRADPQTGPSRPAGPRAAATELAAFAHTQRTC